VRLAALAILLVAFVPAARAQGPEVDVSRLPGPQSEAAIAIDPSNGRILLAGSNSFSEGTMRAYGSTDGGATWQTTTVYPAPASTKAACAADPGVAIDGRGRQYYSFVRSTPCTTGPPHLYVASRPGPAATWGKPVLVAPLRLSRFDDKPAIAVDNSPSSPHHNRVYVAWTRVSRNGVLSILVSHSDGGGRTWSPLVRANRTGTEETYASIAVSRSGIVYVAWNDITNFHINISRSTDGGAHFGPERKAAAFTIVTIPHCGSGIVIPAQRLTCVQPNPIVSVDTSAGPYSGRVYVTYTTTAFFGDQGASVTVFNSRLRILLGRSSGTVPGLQVAPAPKGENSDQFWTQSAVDPSTGAVWICFYDTRGDPKRTSALYSCSVSNNGGGTWAPPVHAATVASNETQPGADPHEYGDYEGLAVAGGVAHPIWTDSRDLETLAEEIYTTTLSPADFTSP
jgi:hypothetical protein